MSRPESPDPSSHAATIYEVSELEDGRFGETDDDDDMDFEPATDQSDDVEFFDSVESAGIEVASNDAGDSLTGFSVELSVEEEEEEDGVEGDGEENETETEASPGLTPAAPTSRAQRQSLPAQIVRLFGHAGLRRILETHGTGQPRFTADLDERDDSDEEDGQFHRRRRTNTRKAVFPPIPSLEGKRLMDGGIYGDRGHYKDRRMRKKTNLARKLMNRELGTNRTESARCTRSLSQGMLPSSNADTIIHYNSRCYSGQFSEDGNFFFSCAQDFKVRMYDTSNPYRWKYYKTVLYPYGQWTITDASLSPDNKWLAYSSIRSRVCLAPTDPGSSGEPYLLDFSNLGERGSRRNQGFLGGYSDFGIWSIRFSGDGREIVAGTSDHSVYVYDLERRQSVLSIPGHNDHVNAVCFGDQSSPHILYSGSDDTTIKVWDRRSLQDKREAGVFMGHTEGLTYVDSKGDGRYVLSNGKDQTMKLWDLRKMMSTEKASGIDPKRYTSSFDYRFMSYGEKDYQPHPHDCSLVTFRGHRVLKTLIRCHFSPTGSTNSRYVYSGSEDGSVYIYNLDATLAGKVDVNQATHHSRPRDPDMYMSSYAPEESGNRGTWKTCVRDASWHPNAPIIAATSWNGWGMSTGTCTMHSWNDGAEDDEGEPKMGLRVDQRLQLDDDLYDDPRLRPRTRLRTRRVAADDANDRHW